MSAIVAGLYLEAQCAITVRRLYASALGDCICESYNGNAIYQYFTRLRMWWQHGWLYLQTMVVVVAWLRHSASSDDHDLHIERGCGKSELVVPQKRCEHHTVFVDCVRFSQQLEVFH